MSGGTYFILPCSLMTQGRSLGVPQGLQQPCFWGGSQGEQLTGQLCSRDQWFLLCTGSALLARCFCSLPSQRQMASEIRQTRQGQGRLPSRTRQLR